MGALYDDTVLDLVRAGRADTQADLCRLTGLSSSTMCAILRRLRGSGLVRAVGTRPTGRGKPATVLRFAPAGHLLAVDIDGSQALVGVLEFDGTIRAEAT